MRLRWVQCWVMRGLKFAVLLAALALSGCPSPEDAARQAPQPAPAAVDGAGPKAGASPETEAAVPPPVPELAAPRQLILIYSGDTLSRAGPSLDQSPPEGGLCALAATIADYQGMMVEFNRRRVENAGQDASHLRVDYDAGLLGEHPYMLLDYGGWTRPNDFAGAPYVELYLRMFEALAYTAVGCKLYQRLPAERWDAYTERPPDRFRLLVSAGELRAEALPSVPIVTREVRGRRWGIVHVPLPSDPGPAAFNSPEEHIGQQAAQLDGYVTEAAGRLADNECDYSILLLSEGPSSLYRELAEEAPFTVIIGAPPALSVPEGQGLMPSRGALLLPTLTGNGREIGVCHVYFTETGDKPEMYYFSLKPCIDDVNQPWPFRPQVAEAQAEHDQLVADWMGG